jgi:hypothetical protein
VPHTTTGEHSVGSLAHVPSLQRKRDESGHPETVSHRSREAAQEPSGHRAGRAAGHSGQLLRAPEQSPLGHRTVLGGAQPVLRSRHWSSAATHTPLRQRTGLAALGQAEAGSRAGRDAHAAASLAHRPPGQRTGLRLGQPFSRGQRSAEAAQEPSSHRFVYGLGQVLATASRQVESPQRVDPEGQGARSRQRLEPATHEPSAQRGRARALDLVGRDARALRGGAQPPGAPERPAGRARRQDPEAVPTLGKPVGAEEGLGRVRRARGGRQCGALGLVRGAHGQVSAAAVASPPQHETRQAPPHQTFPAGQPSRTAGHSAPLARCRTAQAWPRPGTSSRHSGRRPGRRGSCWSRRSGRASGRSPSTSWPRGSRRGRRDRSSPSTSPGARTGRSRRWGTARTRPSTKRPGTLRARRPGSAGRRGRGRWRPGTSCHLKPRLIVLQRTGHDTGVGHAASDGAHPPLSHSASPVAQRCASAGHSAAVRAQELSQHLTGRAPG